MTLALTAPETTHPQTAPHRGIPVAETSEERPQHVIPAFVLGRTTSIDFTLVRAGDRLIHGDERHVIELEVLDGAALSRSDASGQPVNVRRVRRLDRGTITTLQFAPGGCCHVATVCTTHQGAVGMDPHCLACAPVIA